MEIESAEDVHKFEMCKKELRVLLKKLVDGGYHLTARQIFDLMANSGVETKLNPKLINRITLEEFLKEK